MCVGQETRRKQRARVKKIRTRMAATSASINMADHEAISGMSGTLHGGPSRRLAKLAQVGFPNMGRPCAQAGFLNMGRPCAQVGFLNMGRPCAQVT